MKKQLTAISIIGNVALLAALLWMRAGYEGKLRAVSDAAIHGDEVHMRLHASSLAALESSDPKEATTTATMLRAILAAGDLNTESRQRAGLGK